MLQMLLVLLPGLLLLLPPPPPPPPPPLLQLQQLPLLLLLLVVLLLPTSSCRKCLPRVARQDALRLTHAMMMIAKKPDTYKSFQQHEQAAEAHGEGLFGRLRDPHGPFLGKGFGWVVGGRFAIDA